MKRGDEALPKADEGEKDPSEPRENRERDLRPEDEYRTQKNFEAAPQ